MIFQRLLTRGDIPESAGGLYNPSVIPGRMLVRREVDYTWKQPSFPTFIDRQTGAHETLRIVGYPPDTRIEDCRLFPWRESLLVSHVAYTIRNGKPIYPVHQRLSVVVGDQLQPWEDWRLPVPMKRVEKNWVLAATDDALYCVYSLDPFIVCRRTSEGAWDLAQQTETGLTRAFGKEPHNSTHLLPFEGGYLGLWHFIKPDTRSTYVTGAYWLDEQLALRAVTAALLDGAWVQGDVYKCGVCYVSSATINGETVQMFYGEGDAHTGVATMPVATVRAALREAAWGGATRF